jgi:hypothetical protein
VVEIALTRVVSSRNSKRRKSQTNADGKSIKAEGRIKN